MTTSIAHLVVLCVGLVLLLVLCVLLRLPAHKRPSRTLLRWLATGALLLLSTPLAFLGLSILIADQARETAGSEPYCIQVAENGKGYRPATGLLDLSPLTMRASRSNGVNLQYRALLIVGRGSDLRVYHWSYHEFSFTNGYHWQPIGGPTFRCSPIERFAETLPIIPSGEAETTYIRLNKHAYRIPADYRPDPTSGEHPSIMVSTSPPDFAPSLPSDDRSLVKIDLAPVMPLEKSAMMSVRLKGKEAVEQSVEYGLRKVSYGSDGTAWLAVYSLDRNGRTETLIICDVPRTKPANCQHYFLLDGIQYWFFYDSASVKDWRQMESKLVATVQGWSDNI